LNYSHVAKNTKIPLSYKKRDFVKSVHVFLFSDELTGYYNIVLNILLKFVRKVYLNMEFVKGFFKDTGKVRRSRDKK
jgi:hypothetical protein